jgi:hypothetical protein
VDAGRELAALEFFFRREIALVFIGDHQRPHRRAAERERDFGIAAVADGDAVEIAEGYREVDHELSPYW